MVFEKDFGFILCSHVKVSPRRFTLQVALPGHMYLGSSNEFYVFSEAQKDLKFLST